MSCTGGSLARLILASTALRVAGGGTRASRTWRALRAAADEHRLAIAAVNGQILQDLNLAQPQFYGRPGKAHSQKADRNGRPRPAGEPGPGGGWIRR